MLSRQSFFRSFCCSICAICLSTSILVCNVYADDIYLGTTHLLTSDETLVIFGSELSGIYYNGQAYENCTFEYVTTLDYSKMHYLNVNDTTGYYGNTDFSFLIYRCPIIPSNDTNAEFTVKLEPSNFNFSTCSYFSCSCGISIGDVYIVNSDNRNDWIVNVDGIETTYTALSQSAPIYWGSLNLTIPLSVDLNNTADIAFRPIVFSKTSATPFSLSSGNITFSRAIYSLTNVDSGGGVYFFITTPKVSDDLQWIPPGGGGDDDSGLLSGIKGLIESIVDTLQNLGSNIANFIIQGLQTLFVPSESDLTGFKDDLDDLLSDTFGTAYESNTLIHTAIDDISGVSESDSSIYFPGVYFREYTIIAPQNVAIKPVGFDSLFNALARAIDIIATFGVINALKHRFERGIMENDG